MNPLPIPIQPYSFTDAELTSNGFSEVQLAVLKNLAWQTLTQLALAKRLDVSVAGLHIYLQNEANLRGRLDLLLELLNVSEFDLFGVESTPPNSASA